MLPQFLIAAPSSGSGKTTITQGLLRSLSNKGFSVQPFKCGPDYIDTKHHEWASRNVSINLDTFMSNPEHVKEIYAKYSSKADASVVEGVMGLFDGANRMKGSSAEIAELLDIPIILVINAKATAYSVAPLLYGYKHFYPGIKIAGAIFNFVNSESHYQFMKDACEDVGVQALGYVPRNENINLPERHLGLQISAKDNYEDTINAMALHLEKTVDIDRILDICKSKRPNYKASLNKTNSKIRIGVAKDEAFNFTYHENLRSLSEIGKISYFSPINDSILPDVDFIYLAGGYPELYLEKLSQNISMRRAIQDFAKSGGKILAECGGMMYLSKNIIDKDGNLFPMVGFLDQNASMENMTLKLGYRKIKLKEETLFGHEFHYSHLVDSKEETKDIEVYSARDKRLDTQLIRKNNVLASYIHFYWGEKNIYTTFWDK
ncbi:cobyrinate a,c-diamide synthase [Ancylomarina euxinus]|uniref:Cobyrinate a,c-diamide synthase n=1 Tax=Ancylomarina euxinus TaxID=2283627 RepID=A0A425XWS9_9BACT|nr:cobyrinate a,c-diamide synthase [Ancylomarina euxinus]MCZ4696316.1 cobyrinate a,c-diamide synthase [Ancylomarina euxinus]MUP16719.1 cobyrinate a,c-diamide synthase [Ancylomarina euxinus]RRG19103.1 cobyrinate a,c-diamide synthase [Ancylomarina euxinus]